ncbi:MAG: biotin/lipoyl-binding protein [Anaerolineae bacterium]|nr:biotin/lipoyl-binding protein [Anaerolineae bacterium]
MPTYRVTIAGRIYTVEVPNPNERPVRAIVDGEVIEVAVEMPVQAYAPSQTLAPVSVAPVAAQPAVTAPAPVPPPAPVSVPAGGGASNVVKAPLPGTVVNISVSEGDRVAYGQELCTLEAMKMNNPIRATQAGVVTAIHIRIGEQVQHGAPLVTLEG